MSYTLKMPQIISLPRKAQNDATEEILSNFTYGKKWDLRYTDAENTITVGDHTVVELAEHEYVVNVTSSGVYIKGENHGTVMRGLFALLDTIKYNDAEDSFYFEEGFISGDPKIKLRGVHFCIFPETKLDFLKKCIRSCAIVKYSHVILEFWGMFRFDCLKELSWNFSYTKDQVRELVAEANALGLEVIPMFNHLGHASACREVNGKHVVLDQAPRLEYMFESFGWVWNIRREDVKSLHRAVRDELIEVSGEGKYFHIGFDEAYAYGHDVSKAADMAEYVNEISRELQKKGRRAIMWHDMMASAREFPEYTASASDEVSELLLESIDREVIIADWQYGRYVSPWRTSEKFKENGFDTVCCPWDNKRNVSSAVECVTSNSLYGIIHTTWHTLNIRGFREMIYAGVLSYGTDKKGLDDIHRFYCANVARKAMPADGSYPDCGWSEKMTGPGQ